LGGSIVDATSGNMLKKGYRMMDGEMRYTITDDVMLSIFHGSNLVKSVKVDRGKFKLDLPAGDYTCQATVEAFYAYYDDECVISAGGELQKTIAMSPMLSPGAARVVLQWGSDPQDLDSYMTAPSGKPNKECEVSFRNRKCDGGVVHLDVDQMRGFGPETITLENISLDFTYRYRVHAYGARGKSEGLLRSGAQVALYTEEYTHIFELGKDGFVEKDSWFVFSIDGATKQWAVCTRATCSTDVKNT